GFYGRGDRPGRVDVFGLRAGTELGGADGHEGHVGVTTDVTAFHAGIGDPQGFDDVANGGQVGACQFWGTFTGTGDGFGHNFDQWDTRTVVVHQRRRGVMNATGRATNVGEFAGVFFDMGAFDFHPEDFAVVEFNIYPSVIGDGGFFLGGLVVLAQVWVEVLFAGKPGFWCDRAVQCQTEFDAVINTGGVDSWQGTGQAEVTGGDIGVGLVSERVGCGGEHFGLGIQFNVDFESENDFIRLQGLFHDAAPAVIFSTTALMR